jgi:glycosyltransferase involved in cell wall biosynthesis
LDSLLDQDLAVSDYEIIVVDDGSEEEPVVLKDYANRYPQVQYHRIEHAGLSPARNYGFSVAKGDWILLCDSDDFVQRQVLGRLIAEADARNLEMMYVRIKSIFPPYDTPEPHANFDNISQVMELREMVGGHPAFTTVAVGAYLLRRDFLVKNDISFHKIFYVEERLYMLDLIRTVKRVAYFDVELYYYVQQDDSILHKKRRQNGADYVTSVMYYLEKLAELMKDPELPAAAVAYLKRKELSVMSSNLLETAFRACPVEETAGYVKRLDELGAYPLLLPEKLSRRWVKVFLRNRKKTWLILCRIYHIFK